MKIIIADANAKIGRQEYYRPTIGQYNLYSDTNKNERLLIEMTATRKNVNI